MRRLLLLATIIALCFGGFASASSAAKQPVPFPASPGGLKPPGPLPKAMDPTPAYVPQISCQPGTPAGVAKLRELVLKTYGVGGAGNTARKCNEGTSEHSDGRAWDWMVNVKNANEKKAAGDFLAWLTADHGANAKRLGVMYVIHNKMIWGVYREKDGWRPSYGHTDHIHISFSWNGARGNTSFWTGAVQKVDRGPCAAFAGQPAVTSSTPRLSACPKPTALLRRHPNAIAQLGSKAKSVASAQSLLKVKQTKTFDTATMKAVRDYQRAHDLPITGTLDVPTWASLIPAKATGDVTDGYDAKEAARYGLANYAGTPLGLKSIGKATIFLQDALGLGVADRNGYFGVVTLAAVRQLQADNGLDETGIVGEAEWQALARR